MNPLDFHGQNTNPLRFIYLHSDITLNKLDIHTNIKRKLNTQTSNVELLVCPGKCVIVQAVGISKHMTTIQTLAIMIGKSYNTPR